jgi:Amt family ammonium transporter
VKRLAALWPIVLLGLWLDPVPAHAQSSPDTGATAWLLTSTALVLLMTLPGLALFYGGLVRSRNVLSVLMQCFALCCVVSLLWLAFGYSVAFSASGPAGLFGGLSKAWLRGVELDSVSGAVPETAFVMFQLTFAIITPALIIGGFAERTRFSAMLLFCSLWLAIVYLPIGFGAAAGLPISGSEISRVARSCTSMRVSRRSSRRS